MAVETLRPNANGTTNAWEAQFPVSGVHYDKVDEVSADDATTYIEDLSESWIYDLFAIPNHSEGSGLINKVTVYIEAFAGSAVLSGAYGALRTHSTNYSGGTPANEVAWTTEAWERTTNPNTSSAWTWDEIDALEIGVYGIGSGGNYIRCTQVYVEVDYEPLVEREAAVDVGIDPSASRSLKLARESSVDVGIEATADRRCVYHRYGWRP